MKTMHTTINCCSSGTTVQPALTPQSLTDRAAPVAGITSSNHSGKQLLYCVSGKLKKNGLDL